MVPVYAAFNPRLSVSLLANYRREVENKNNSWWTLEFAIHVHQFVYSVCGYPSAETCVIYQGKILYDTSYIIYARNYDNFFRELIWY